MKYTFDSSTLTYFIEKLKEKFSLKTEVTEQINELEKIESSEIEPADEMVSLWINTSEDESTNVIARINDDTVASNTTWSSEKINASIISGGSSSGGSDNVDLSAYALKTDLHEHNNKTVLDNITSAKVTEWNNKSTFSGNYNDLTNKPTIPTKTSELTNDSEFITEIPTEYITETELNNKGYLTEHQSLENYAKISDLHSHSNKSVLDNITSDKVTEWNNKSTFSGSYNDLTDKPTIPTVTNDLTNTLKSNYDTAYTHSQSAHAPSNAQKNSDITKTEIEAKLTGDITSHTHSQYLTEHQSLENYALKSEIPTNYLTSIPSEYVTETELTAKGYITEHQDLSDYALKSEIPTDYITSIPSEYITETELEDKGYITEIPSEYITETELTAKGYLTEHQDISEKADKTELHEHTNKTVLDAITSDMTTKWNQSIPFDDTYVSDCNTWLTTGYIKTGAGQTSNLPSVCTGTDRWGILFFIAENVTQGTGTQMYFPIDGTYKGRIFTRSLTNMLDAGSSVGDWYLLATTNDIETSSVATTSLSDEETSTIETEIEERIISNLSLGIHSDGLLYIFYNENPIGNGINININNE